MTGARRTCGCGLFLLLVTLAAYAPALRGDFLWDDTAYVRDNPTLRSLEGLWHIWSPAHWGSTPQYYPMVFTTFWIEWQLWGDWTLGYHLVNVLLHAANALLLWHVLRVLHVPGALLAAALFALHPVHVESVAWISERKNVLSALFYLAALSAYLKFLPLDETTDLPRTPRHWSWYIVAEVLFLAALLSKTVVATLPAAILLLVWFRRGRIDLRNIAFTLPLFAWAVVLGTVTIYYERRFVGAWGPDFNFDLAQRCLIAGRAVWFYAGKLVWPYPLSFFYPRWELDTGSFLQMLFPLSELAVVAVLLLLARRIGRGPAAAVLYFMGTLVPALGFVNVYPMRFSFVADHFQYLASIGLLALLAAGAARAFEKARVPAWLAGTAAAGVLGVLAGLTFLQARHYQDAQSLWSATIQTNPQSWTAHNNLGTLLAEQGKLDEARRHFSRAIELRPDAPEPYTNQGILYERQGDPISAARLYSQALRADPRYPEANLRMGRHLARLGRINLAAKYFQSAVVAQPNNPEARYNFAVALAQLGQPQQAKEQLQRALQLAPDHVDARVALAEVLWQTGDEPQALSLLEETVARSPGAASAHYALARLYRHRGQPLRAAETYRRTLEVNPEHLEAALGLAYLLATHPDSSVRDGHQALRWAQHALKLADPADPDYPHYLDTLAAACAELGQFDQAVEHSRRAVELAEKQRPPAVPTLRKRLELYQAGKPLRQP